MRSSFRLFILTLAGASLLASCAPKQQKLQLDHPPQDFTPRLDDTDVKSQGLFSLDFDQTISLKGQMKPAMIYRLSENLMQIGVQEKSDELNNSGKTILEKLLAVPGLAPKTTADQSPYVQLAISETEKEVNQALDEIDRQLKSSIEQLNITLQELGATYPWPQGPQTLTTGGKTISGFLGKFLEQANALNIFDVMKSQLQVEIGKQQTWIEKLTAEADQELQSVKHFPELLKYIYELMNREKMTPPEGMKKTLGQARVLSDDLIACHSDQAVLTTIVDVWGMLDDQERVQYIKPQSEDLYKLLNKSDEGDLKCLRQSGCLNPLKFLVKKMGIFPAIQKMGVEKLCQSIDDSVLSYVKNTVQTMLPQAYTAMPGFVSDAISKAIADKMTLLDQVHHNYSGFLKTQTLAWAQKNLPGKGFVRGIDAGQLQISMNQKELKMTAVPGNATAESFGSSFSALSEYFAQADADQNQVLQSSFDVINHLVALGGYKTETGSLTPALLTPLEINAPILDLMNLTAAKAAYGMTDQFAIVNTFAPKEIHPRQISMSAKSQAEMIRGLSKVIGYLRDWKTSAYDKTLGQITAATLVPDYQDVTELQRSMFPKAELMTLAIGDLAVMLENLTKKMAQVFVVGLHDNKVTWVNDYDMENGGLVAMAGVVDLSNGVRDNVVKSQNLSRWILAMSEFLLNTKDIEKTKSDILLEKDASGASSLDSLVKARRQLALLTVAFSNLLSHQMVDKDGLVMPQLKLSDIVATDLTPKALLDQAMAIQALNLAAEATGIGIYRVAATEIYYNLNSKKYSAKMHFYSMSGQTENVDLETLTEMSRAVSDLKPGLPEKSQRQAEWILEPWLQSLSQIH